MIRSRALLGTKLDRLIRELTSGEAEDFPEFYQNYRKLIRNCIFRISGEENLDESVQEAFIKIWKGMPLFNRKSKLKTWIYRIAVNTAIENLRKKKKHTELLNEPPAPDHEGAFIAKELVHMGLATLSEEHRVVIVLSMLEELKIREISKIMGVSEGTVKSRLHYARRKLKEFFEKNGISDL